MRMTPNRLYFHLVEKLGHQQWWPIDQEHHKKNGSDPRFEIIIGAILTQNTAWTNVEVAIENLKKENMLDIKNIVKIEPERLQTMIKSSGYFNQKATRLKNIAVYLLKNYQGDLDVFFQKNLTNLRDELLSLNGIGPETADSILLYAGQKPIFVVDAYTKRLCERLPLNVTISYDAIQTYFQKDLSTHFQDEKLIQVYNELHALIVLLGKTYCRRKPLCETCPLRKDCQYPKETVI